jgi:hypothetical protein
MAEILLLEARHQADAVRLECIEGVFDLLQAALGIGQRDRRPQSEPARMIRHHHGAQLVDLTRDGTALGHVVLEPCAGLDDRHDRRRDPVPVHLGERNLGRPGTRP